MGGQISYSQGGGWSGSISGGYSTSLGGGFSLGANLTLGYNETSGWSLGLGGSLGYQSQSLHRLSIGGSVSTPLSDDFGSLDWDFNVGGGIETFSFTKLGQYVTDPALRKEIEFKISIEKSELQKREGEIRASLEVTSPNGGYAQFDLRADAKLGWRNINSMAYGRYSKLFLLDPRNPNKTIYKGSFVQGLWGGFSTSQIHALDYTRGCFGVRAPFLLAYNHTFSALSGALLFSTRYFGQSHWRGAAGARYGYYMYRVGSINWKVY